MALGTNHLVKGDYGDFIPELWSDDVIAAYKANLVVAQHVTVFNHTGKKGDTLHIPTIARGSANPKVAETQVVLNNPSESEVVLSINKHYEYSTLLEDIMAIQGVDSLRRFVTDDAGYALAKQIDTDLTALWEGLNSGATTNGTYGAAYIGSDGATLYDNTASAGAGNGAALADAGIRRLIQRLDDTDTPSTQRVFIIPPVTKNTLLGINRFTENQFVGEAGSANPIRNGYVGDLYGVPVYVSSTCPTITASNASTQYRVGVLLHKGALALVEQLNVRSQTQYKQEHLGWLFTSDTIYGVGELRNASGFAFVVPK